jgi:hypothetical protein
MPIIGASDVAASASAAAPVEAPIAASNVAATPVQAPIAASNIATGASAAAPV